MDDAGELLPEHLREGLPDPQRVHGCGAFLLVFAAIVAAHAALNMPLDIAVFHLPAAAIAGLVISRNVRGFGQRSKRWLAALAVALGIAVSFAVGRSALDGQREAIRAAKAEVGSELLFPCSKKCTEWMRGADGWAILALFAFPFAIVIDALLLPMGLFELLVSALNVLPAAGLLSAIGLLLATPSLLTLYAVDRVLTQQPRAL